MSVMLLDRKMERGTAEREPPSCDIAHQGRLRSFADARAGAKPPA
jgi:hypothetical protein